MVFVIEGSQVCEDIPLHAFHYWRSSQVRDDIPLYLYVFHYMRGSVSSTVCGVACGLPCLHSQRVLRSCRRGDCCSRADSARLPARPAARRASAHPLGGRILHLRRRGHPVWPPLHAGRLVRAHRHLVSILQKAVLALNPYITAPSCNSKLLNGGVEHIWGVLE